MAVTFILWKLVAITCFSVISQYHNWPKDSGLLAKVEGPFLLLKLIKLFSLKKEKSCLWLHNFIPCGTLSKASTLAKQLIDFQLLASGVFWGLLLLCILSQKISILHLMKISAFSFLLFHFLVFWGRLASPYSRNHALGRWPRWL